MIYECTQVKCYIKFEGLHVETTFEGSKVKKDMIKGLKVSTALLYIDILYLTGLGISVQPVQRDVSILQI